MDHSATDYCSTSIMGQMWLKRLGLETASIEKPSLLKGQHRCGLPSLYGAIFASKLPLVWDTSFVGHPLV
ncbi:hypothetical protein Y032_0955g3199 [Ancylostoma ceylanicum]|uniref:Uncharacterized protein n=1 Tax=Ancylostoma ceylanicum TaxID=53326 RepID=A0A016W8J0_9BILA|nr:hypothetical protein Y032_0955g3199 [Ancylostoma ceylanicum]